MKAIQTLPSDYSELFSIDLQKDKKLAIKVNVLSLIIMLIMAISMNFVVPISDLFDISNGINRLLLRCAITFVALIAYIILHEAVHGVAMKFYGCKKVNFGFTALYAYAGSNEYFSKKPYLVIALAPVVFLGIVLLAINFFVPQDWFWVVYFIQIMNVSGAAGDLYVTTKFLQLPDDILVKDIGVSMTVYGKQQK